MRQIIKEVRIKLVEYKSNEKNHYPISYSQDYNGLLQKNNIILTNPNDFLNNVITLAITNTIFTTISISCSFIELASDNFFFLKFDQCSQTLRTKSFSYFGEDKLTNIKVANGTLLVNSDQSLVASTLSSEVSIQATMVS